LHPIYRFVSKRFAIATLEQNSINSENTSRTPVEHQLTVSDDYLHHGSLVWFGLYICPLNHKQIYRAGEKKKTEALSQRGHDEYFLIERLHHCRGDIGYVSGEKR